MAKQELQPYDSRLLVHALIRKIILHTIVLSARLQFEVFRDDRIPERYSRSSEIAQ